MIDENTIEVPSIPTLDRRAFAEGVVAAALLNGAVYGIEPHHFEMPEAAALCRVRRTMPSADAEEIIEKMITNEGLSREAVDDFVGLVIDIAQRENGVRHLMRDPATLDRCVLKLQQHARMRETAAQETEARQRVFEAAPGTTEWISARLDYARAITETTSSRFAIVKQSKSFASALDATLDRLKSTQGKKRIGVDSPAFPRLTESLFGWRGVIVLASGAGIGKTTMCLSAGFAAVAADPEVCLVFFSFEMPTSTLIARTIAQIAKMDERMLYVGQGIGKNADGFALADDQQKRLNEAVEILRRLDHRISIVGNDEIGSVGGVPLDDPRGSCAALEEIIRRSKMGSGCRRAFVVVDYLQVIPMRTPDGGSEWQSDIDRDRYAISGLCRLRDRMGVDDPIVVISQVTKASSANTIGGDLRSIMGTASTGYSADAAILIDRKAADTDAEPDPNAPVDLLVKIAKGRDCMIRRTIEMRFDPKTTEIKEMK